MPHALNTDNLPRYKDCAQTVTIGATTFGSVISSHRHVLPFLCPTCSVPIFLISLHPQLCITNNSLCRQLQYLTTTYQQKAATWKIISKTVLQMSRIVRGYALERQHCELLSYRVEDSCPYSQGLTYSTSLHSQGKGKGKVTPLQARFWPRGG
jgi:hypothetical protein